MGLKNKSKQGTPKEVSNIDLNKRHIIINHDYKDYYNQRDF